MHNMCIFGLRQIFLNLNPPRGNILLSVLKTAQQLFSVAELKMQDYFSVDVPKQ